MLTILDPADLIAIRRALESAGRDGARVLVSENPEQRLITVGVSVLLDERQWVPVK